MKKDNLVESYPKSMMIVLIPFPPRVGGLGGHKLPLPTPGAQNPTLAASNPTPLAMNPMKYESKKKY